MCIFLMFKTISWRFVNFKTLSMETCYYFLIQMYWYYKHESNLYFGPISGLPSYSGSWLDVASTTLLEPNTVPILVYPFRYQSRLMQTIKMGVAITTSVHRRTATDASNVPQKWYSSKPTSYSAGLPGIFRFCLIFRCI